MLERNVTWNWNGGYIIYEPYEYKDNFGVQYSAGQSDHTIRNTNKIQY